MPFDEEDDNEEQSLKSKKTGLKNVSSQKSIFDGIIKKPSAQEFDQKVSKVQEQISGYKVRATELAIAFKNAMDDKVLPQNKNVFALELEKDLLSKMAKLAVEVNNDPNELNGMGSISLIISLLKNALAQRDKINKLEYTISLLEKKLNPENIAPLISKEISKVLDNKKQSE